MFLTQNKKAILKRKPRPRPKNIAGLCLIGGYPIWKPTGVEGRLSKHRVGFVWIGFNMIKSKAGNDCRYIHLYFSEKRDLPFKFKARTVLGSSALVELIKTYLSYGELRCYKSLRKVKNYEHLYPNLVKNLKKYSVRHKFTPLTKD